MARGEQFRSLAVDLQNRVPGLIQDVRGWGLINGIELTESSGLTAADVTKVLMENGVLVVPAGPKVVRFVPPLIVTEAEVLLAMKKFEDAVKKLTAAMNNSKNSK
jgi:acetylornithine aminotransferase